MVWPTELILVTSHGNSTLECITTDMYMYIMCFFHHGVTGNLSWHGHPSVPCLTSLQYWSPNLILPVILVFSVPPHCRVLLCDCAFLVCVLLWIVRW